VLRYLVPVFLLIIFFSSLALAPRSLLYALVALAQICFYAAAFLSWLIESRGFRRNRLLALPQ
jgi:hypothetical protein